MQNPPWSSEKRRLARRIRFGYIVRELLFWGPVGLIGWGMTVFLVRFVSSGRMDLMWSGSVFCLASLLFGVYRGYRQGTDVNVTAVLDHLTESENLLVSIEETGTDHDPWRERIDRRLEGGVPMPGFRWSKLCFSVVPALAFLLLVWFVPLAGFTNRTASASSTYLEERVEELREKLKTVEEEEFMPDGEAKQLERKLDQLKSELTTEQRTGDNPWSVLDRVDQELEESMTEGSETVNRARKLSRNLSEQMKKEEGGTPGEGAEDNSSASSRSGTNTKDGAGQQTAGERMERQKEALSRSLARLSRRGMISDPPSGSAAGENKDETDYRSRQRTSSRSSSTSKKMNDRKRNWKKIVSRRKALKKLRRTLRKKHRRMHRKGICRGGNCQLKGNQRGRRTGIARGNGQRPGQKRSGGNPSGNGSKQNPSPDPNGTPATGPGTAPMTEGDTSGKQRSSFTAKKVDAPIVNPGGTKKLNERIRAGENMKPGEASTPSGAQANVDNPLESRRSNVPPSYRDAVKSYFSPKRTD